MKKSEHEIERIKKVYEKRKDIIPKHLYSFFTDSYLFFHQRREGELLKLFKKYNFNSLCEEKILDVGCGSGGELRNLMRYGAQPKNLYGIELGRDKIETAKRLSPNMNFRCGDASEIPYEDNSFDIIMQFIAFTSIIDYEMKNSIAKEMLRVLKPDGIILWYDCLMDNPRHSDLKGVKKKEIYELFPNCDVYLKRITLAPPITRTIATYSWLICIFLEKLKIFNTHYIGIIRKHGYW